MNDQGARAIGLTPPLAASPHPWRPAASDAASPGRQRRLNVVNRSSLIHKPLMALWCRACCWTEAAFWGGVIQPPVTARSLLQKSGEAKNCKARAQHAYNHAAWLMDWPCTHRPGLPGLGANGHISVGPCMHPMHVGRGVASATRRFIPRFHSGTCVYILAYCKSP